MEYKAKDLIEDYLLLRTAKGIEDLKKTTEEENRRKAKADERQADFSREQARKEDREQECAAEEQKRFAIAELEELRRHPHVSQLR